MEGRWEETVLWRYIDRFYQIFTLLFAHTAEGHSCQLKQRKANTACLSHSFIFTEDLPLQQHNVYEGFLAMIAPTVGVSVRLRMSWETVSEMKIRLWYICGTINHCCVWAHVQTFDISKSHFVWMPLPHCVTLLTTQVSSLDMLPVFMICLGKPFPHRVDKRMSQTEILHQKKLPNETKIK